LAIATEPPEPPTDDIIGFHSNDAESEILSFSFLRAIIECYPLIEDTLGVLGFCYRTPGKPFQSPFLIFHKLLWLTLTQGALGALALATPTNRAQTLHKRPLSLQVDWVTVCKSERCLSFPCSYCGL
jgi:hypothetical protein